MTTEQEQSYIFNVILLGVDKKNEFLNYKNIEKRSKRKIEKEQSMSWYLVIIRCLIDIIRKQNEQKKLSNTLIF